MALRRFFSSNHLSSDFDRSSLHSGRPPTYHSNVTPAPAYSGHGVFNRVRAWSANIPNASTAFLSSAGSTTVLEETESSFAETLSVAGTFAEPTPAGPRYIYYRVYTEDGAIPSKASTNTGDPFLGRVKALSVTPPHTILSVRRCLARFEKISDTTRTSLFLTPSSKSPIDETRKADILRRNGLGFRPQEPLALVVLSLESELGVVESTDSVGGEDNTTSPEVRYLYYLLYDKDGESPSKASFDPEQPSLGRIRANSVAPCHTPASIKRRISRVEKNPALAVADLLADVSCDSPMKEIHMQILTGDVPGLSQYKPMVLVQDVAYTRRLRAKITLKPQRRGWLPITAGEIYYTDGIVKGKHYGGGYSRNAYCVKNSEGKTGYIGENCCEFF